jgi:hypothetical protein
MYCNMLNIDLYANIQHNKQNVKYGEYITLLVKF